MLMWESKDQEYPEILARCTYLAETGSFTVVVTHIPTKTSYSESFGQTFTPMFGMDIQDAEESYSIATKLSDQIIAELGLKNGK